MKTTPTLMTLAAVVILSGCTGAIEPSLPGEPGTGGSGGIDLPAGGGSGSIGTNPCSNPNVLGEAPVRRLSHEEYVNSVVDAFGSAAVTAAVNKAAADFITDPISLGFRNNANFLDIKPLLAQQYQSAAEAVAAAASANLTQVLPCAATAGDTCADQYVTRLGRRLYRRDLTSDEKALAMAAYGKGKAYDFAAGIEFATAALLQSPKFLFRFEVDTGTPGTVRALGPDELATRLAALVWHSIPDDALLAAAKGGMLATKEDLAREAARMLADPKAQRQFHFFEEWLNLDELGSTARNVTTFPGLDPKLPDYQRAEAQALVKAVLVDGDAKYSTLLKAPYTFVNGALATHYKIAGVTGTAFQKVDQPAGRMGLLMQGGAMTVHDKETRTSIVRRGVGFRTDLLCQTIDAPPDNVDLNLGPIDQGLSQAERLAQHRTNAACAGCHGRIDPVGQFFETIDAVGRLRATDENGKSIVTSGELTAAEDLTGTYADGAALMGKLGDSAIGRNCFVTQLYRFSMARKEDKTDLCSTTTLRDRFAQSGGDIRDLLVAITQTNDFTRRIVTTPVAP